MSDVTELRSLQKLRSPVSYQWSLSTSLAHDLKAMHDCIAALHGLLTVTLDAVDGLLPHLADSDQIKNALIEKIDVNKRDLVAAKQDLLKEQERLACTQKRRFQLYGD